MAEDENLSGGPYHISRDSWRIVDDRLFIPFGPLCSRVAVVDEVVEKNAHVGSSLLNIATHREAIRLEEFARRTTNIGDAPLYYTAAVPSRVEDPNVRGEYDVAIQLFITPDTLGRFLGPKRE